MIFLQMKKIVKCIITKDTVENKSAPKTYNR